MKQLISYLKRRRRNVKTPAALFSEAISEGIKDALREMEYKPKNKTENKKGTEGNNFYTGTKTGL